MNGEARVAVKKEFIIGTAPDDLYPADALATTSASVTAAGAEADHEEDRPITPVEPPAIADVSAVVSQLAALMLMTPSSAGTEATDYAVREVPADALDQIVEVGALLDQIHSWAVEEAQTFVEAPSQLAEVGAPHVLVVCLATARPRLLAAVLRIVAVLLQHPQSRSELLRALSERQGRAEVLTAPPSSTARARLGLAALLSDLTAVLARHARAVDVVSAALAVGTALMPMPGAVETALCNGMVSEALSASQTLSDHSVIAVAVADFFAAVVAVPVCALTRSEDTEEEEGGDEDEDEEAAAGPSVVPTAVIVTHAGVVLPTLVALAHQHASHLMVKQAVASVCLACARHPENRLRLVEVGAYTVVVESLRSSLCVPALFATCAETIGYLLPFVDALQLRHLIRLLRDALLLTGEVELQMLVLALMLSVIRTSIARAAPAAGPAVGSAGAYAAYQFYPMPPSSVSSPSAMAEAAVPRDDSTARRARIELVPSAVLYSPEDKAVDVLATMRALRVPQLVGHLVDFYRAHDASDVDAQEAHKVQQVVRLASLCLDLLSRPC